MVWYNGALVVNPVTDQILVDTGIIGPRPLMLDILVGTNVGIELTLEEYDTNGVINDQLVPVTQAWFHERIPLVLHAGNGLRLKVRGGQTGNVEASLVVAAPRF